MNFIDLLFIFITVFMVLGGIALIKWNQNKKIVIYTGVLIIIYAVLLLTLKIID